MTLPAPELLMQALIAGVLIGCVYTLISIGLSLIWGVMRIVNFAHGEFLMIGMYIVYYLVSGGGWNVYMTALVAAPALFFIGMGVFHYTIRPILGHDSMNQIMLTLGLSLILQNAAQAVFKANVLTVRTPYTAWIYPLFDGKVILRMSQVIAAVGALLTTFALYWFLQKTDAGRSIRAAAQNRNAATLMGINVEQTYRLAFGLGTGTLGVAAALMTPFYYVSPTVGLFFGLVAYIVVVMGGLGSFIGTLLAGLIIALTEEVGKVFLAEGADARALMFIVFVLVLLVLPQGILAGRRQR